MAFKPTFISSDELAKYNYNKPGHNIPSEVKTTEKFLCQQAKIFCIDKIEQVL